MTRRQRIHDCLRQGPTSLEDLAAEVGAPTRSVLDDLEHVRRGVRSPERWVSHQSRCYACDFVFRGRDRLNTPSRCPQCKSEDIQDPEFEIVGGD